MKQDEVKEIRLQDNNLDSTAVPLICELMDLCPYLVRLDLKRNKLDDQALADLQTFVERIPGVTSVTVDPATKDMKAKSGHQIRLIVSVEDQTPPDPDAPSSPLAADATGDMAAAATDGFLASAAGLTSQNKLQGLDGPSGLGARSLGASQKAGGAGKPQGDGKQSPTSTRQSVGGAKR